MARGSVSGLTSMVCLYWAESPPPQSLRTHSLPHAVCQGHGGRCLYSHLTGIFSLASLQPKQLDPTEEVLVLGWRAARVCAAGRTSGSLQHSQHLCSFVQSSGARLRFCDGPDMSLTARVGRGEISLGGTSDELTCFKTCWSTVSS